MYTLRLNIVRFRKDERGFTLPEVLITIAILGILIAIAIPTWQSVVEGRRVDSAANQFASDLRLAHSRATNQLTDWRVAYTEGSGNYELRKLSDVCDDDAGCGASPPTDKVISRSLPEGTKIHADSTNDLGGAGGEEIIELNSDGSGRALSGPSATIVVSSTDDDPKRSMTFAAATSRVKLD